MVPGFFATDIPMNKQSPQLRGWPCRAAARVRLQPKPFSLGLPAGAALVAIVRASPRLPGLTLKPLSLAASLLATTLGATAQDTVPGPGDNTPRAPGTRMERVEIRGRATDTELRRREPVAKQVYGREELDKYGDTNVGDVLKRLPGVSMQGNAPRMRGLGAGYTLILINGDPAPPGFQFDQLNPAQVERIEVSRGGTADRSAQAVAGTINIILKDAPRVAQRDLRLGAGFNAVRPTGSATFTLGERSGGVGYSLPVSVFQWRNINEGELERRTMGSDGQPSAALQKSRQDNLGKGFNTAPRINWKISDDESASAQGFVQSGHWFNNNRYRNQVLFGQPVLDANSRFEGTWQNVRGNLQWNKRYSDDGSIELKLGAQESKGTFDGITDQQRRIFGDSHDLSATQSGKTSRFIGEAHTLAAGWDVEVRRREERRTVTDRGVPQLTDFEGQPFSARIARQALFIQDEWAISPQWSAYLGVRGERIQTESSGLAVPATNTSQVVTPMVHLNYKFDAKARDMVRASVTRSYKAPELNALLARPALSSLFTDTSQTNSLASPDRRGNPALKPELATGLDVAYESYFPGGGLFSIGGFYRSVNDLVRNVTRLETVPWATVPRYVSTPVNFSKATTMGLELELKGRASELLPQVFDAKTALNFRASLNFYRSDVQALQGPDNRLDGQQPWSGNVGLDYRFAALPLSMGGTLAYTPGYLTRQTELQSLDLTRARGIDVFAVWNFSRSTALRLSANNLAPLDTESRTSFTNGDATRNLRKGRTFFGANLELKL
jgi:outer membrane receptor for ferrienterochelin and colicins